MATRKVSQEELDHLIEDARYLQDEIEALTYVIESVPYREEPPGGKSIAETLILVDHAQTSYYRPIFDRVAEQKGTIDVTDLEYYSDTFSFDITELKDIQKRLRKTVKHRAALINTMKRIPLIDWDQTVLREGREQTAFEVAREMVHKERGMLKQVAERVMVLSKDRESQRQIDRKHQERA